jgi:hypothetical protein
MECEAFRLHQLEKLMPQFGPVVHDDDVGVKDDSGSWGTWTSARLEAQKKRRRREANATFVYECRF